MCNCKNTLRVSSKNWLQLQLKWVWVKQPLAATHGLTECQLQNFSFLGKKTITTTDRQANKWTGLKTHTQKFFFKRLQEEGNKRWKAKNTNSNNNKQTQNKRKKERRKKTAMDLLPLFKFSQSAWHCPQNFYQGTPQPQCNTWNFFITQSPCLLIGTIMYSLTTNQHVTAKTPSEFPPKKLIAAAIETGLRVKQPLAATQWVPKTHFCIQLFPLQFQCRMVSFFKHEAKMEAPCAVRIGMGEKKDV